jgi:hypothetical protein
MADLAHAHAVYDYDGHRLTLMYSADKVGVWELYEGVKYLGLIVETHTGAEDGYAIRVPGAEEDDRADETNDDWRSAVRRLVGTG